MDKKRIVIPGELLSDDTALSGSGTYISGGKVYASVCGLLVQKGKLSVHPLSGPYLPKKNDLIIGYVTVVTSSNWIFDINCPYEGLLHVTEYPLRVPSEEMLQHFDIGDTVLLKVVDVNSEMKIELTYKDSVCKKLTKGRLHEVPFSKVSRIIGRSGGMISMLKTKTGCDIFVGGNGRIWMNGDSTDMDILMRALNKIENDARLPGLTDLTAAFIDEQYEAVGRQSHDAVKSKTAGSNESESVAESAANSGRNGAVEFEEKPVSRRKKSGAVNTKKPVIESSVAALEELPKKPRGIKKEEAENASESQIETAENPAKKPVKKPRLTQPEAYKQENCSCFKSVFFTHPPVHQGNKSDR